MARGTLVPPRTRHAAPQTSPPETQTPAAQSSHGPRDGVHDAATLQQNLGTIGLPLEGRGAKVNREIKDTVVKIIMSWKLGHYIGTNTFSKNYVTLQSLKMTHHGITAYGTWSVACM